LYAIYDTKDGEWIALGGQEMKFAVNILTLLGRPDLISLCNSPPGPDQDPVRDFLRDTFLKRTKSDWIAFFAGLDVPFAPVQTLPEVLEDPHFRMRKAVLTDSRGWDHIGTAFAFADEPGRPRLDPPALGQHSTEILRRSGFTENEISHLVTEGIVKSATADEVAKHSGSGAAATAH
jgi:crotonobetainyl-CoA:carnitine CoA-transferase CaiB-like acyl-CoA transferase